MQKTAYWRRAAYVGNRPITKIVLVMKLTMLLLTVSFLNVYATSHSQSITFSGTNVPMKEVFTAIKKQTGYVFFFQESNLQKVSSVTIDAVRQPLEQFLIQLFREQPIDFVIRSKTIVLSRKVKDLPDIPSSDMLAEQPATPIKGRVTDSIGNPLEKATIRNQNTKKAVFSGRDGIFSIDGKEGDVLVVSYVGYEPHSLNVTTSLLSAANNLVISLIPAVNKLDDVEVVINTGYQKLKPNEMAGAVDVITKKMLMEQTGSTVMERLVGMSGSLNFTNKVLPGSTTGNPNSVLNMTIRGYSTISGTTDPLIIVNNFPYTGDIDNLDPNDIENIVILKDAAATAMWGIRAANGVIVITTSGSKFNQKTRVNFRSTTTITEKPDLNKIDVSDGPEAYDFMAEYRGRLLSNNAALNNAVPELDYLGWQYYKAGTITQDEFDSRLNALKAINPRKQWSDLLYKTGVSQTYSLNISGGSENLAWTIAGSFDQGNGILHAKSRRSNIRMNTIYKLTDQLSVELGIAYTGSSAKTGAPAYNAKKDYTSLVNWPLTNADGTPYGWWANKSPNRMDTVGGGLYGDMKYYPLNDWKHDYTNSNLTNYVKNFTVKYSPLRGLDISGNFQSIDQTATANNILDQESAFTRYHRAFFSQINYATDFITYHLPKGEFRKIRNNSNNSYNARVDINYKREINKGILLFNGAFDVSESKTYSDGQFLAGYVETPRSYIYLPQDLTIFSSVTGKLELASYGLGVEDFIAPRELTQRNISTTASLSYVYDDRIIFNANARRDGANILGVNVNERWKPNYSIALNWKIHKEKFFDIPFISNLSAGVSFGYLGNVDVSKSSRIIANVTGYNIVFTDLELNYAVSTPPNPELRWEKTAHTNFKLDIGLLNDRLQFRTNYFIKNVSDLYLTTRVDPIQSLANNYVANAGEMTVKGYEINIQAKVIKSPLNYDITFTTARINERIKYYPNINTPALNLSAAIRDDGASFTSTPPLLAGMPLFSIFTLNGRQGVNDQGQYYIDYKGVEYTSYAVLLDELNNQAVDMEGVKYYGTGTPKFTGSMHHRFNYGRFFLLFSLQAELGHYFKYPKDQLNVRELTAQFENSWKNPGDELHTNIPKYSYPEDPSRQLYIYLADENVFNGGVIRLNNIQLNYEIPTKKLRMLNLAFNIQNVGKIWTANKEGYDYQHLNFMTYNGQNKQYAVTLNVGL